MSGIEHKPTSADLDAIAFRIGVALNARFADQVGTKVHPADRPVLLAKIRLAFEELVRGDVDLQRRGLEGRIKFDGGKVIIEVFEAE